MPGASDVTKCPFCDCRSRPYWGKVNVWKCFSCGLLFRNPLPDQQDLAALYQESWLEPSKNREETGGTDLALARTYAAKLARSVCREDFRELRILDFGAGRGAMLGALAGLGAEVYAVEPFGYEYLKERDIQVFRGLEEISEGLVFDGIVSIDVIEHLREPWIELRQLRAILRESGWIYITTPNFHSLGSMLWKSNWRDTLRKGHLVFFTPRTLERVMSTCGFAGFRRLRWRIQYSKNPIRTVIHAALQWSYLDGQLRYIAWI